MSTNAALLAPTAVAVKAERHGGTWFTYDAEGFVIDAGLCEMDALDAVWAGRNLGQSLAEWQREEDLARDEYWAKRDAEWEARGW